jgi:hypothetical protein
LPLTSSPISIVWIWKELICIFMLLIGNGLDWCRA